MESTLMAFQIVFYAIFSIVILAAGIIGIIVGIYVVRIAKDLEKIAKNAQAITDDVRVRIEGAIESLSTLPFLSFFMKSSARKSERKKKVE